MKHQNQNPVALAGASRVGKTNSSSILYISDFSETPSQTQVAIILSNRHSVSIHYARVICNLQQMGAQNG